MARVRVRTILILAGLMACGLRAQAQTEITPGAGAVTASTNDGNIPGNAVDNSLTTRWSANGDGQWLRFDLGTSQTLANVRIAFYLGNTRTTRFDLQLSNDGAAWTNVLTNVTSGGSTTQEQTFDFPDQSARYVRYMGHGNSVNSWNSLTEVSIFAAGAAPRVTPTPTPTPATPRSTPTPTQSGGTVLFRNTGTTSGWNGTVVEHNGSVSQVSSPVYKGSEALRVTQIYDANYSGRYHSEVYRNDGYRPGQRRFYGFAFYIPSNWQTVSQGYNIAQFIANFGDTGCDDWMPSTMMWFTNSGLSTRVKQGTICSQSIRTFGNFATLSYGVWHRIVIDGNWQANTSGHLRVWVDGTVRLDQSGLQTTLSDPANRTFSVRYGMYANSWYDQKKMVGTQPMRTLHYDHFSIGTTYADADPAAW